MDDLKPKKRKSRKGLAWFISILIIALDIRLCQILLVFRIGVKSGELNYLVYKGVVSKRMKGN